jgi:hypothetical protein
MHTEDNTYGLKITEEYSECHIHLTPSDKCWAEVGEFGRGRNYNLKIQTQ